MKPFVINRRGSLVLPSNFFPAIDFTALDSMGELAALIHRDFDSKGPSGATLLKRIESGAYRSRYELLRELALHLFWVNRFSLTLYEQRPYCWRHVPKRREDVFLPIVSPWKDSERKIAAVQAAYQSLPATWSSEAEYRIFTRLFDLFRNRRYQAAELPPLLPTVGEFLESPDNLTFHIALYDPDFSTFSYEEILDCREEIPELEALMRWTMVLYNQYPWHREHTRLIASGKIRDDDVVALFTPRSREALEFIRRAKSGASRPVATAPVAPAQSRHRVTPAGESTPAFSCQASARGAGGHQR